MGTAAAAGVGTLLGEAAGLAAVSATVSSAVSATVRGAAKDAPAGGDTAPAVPVGDSVRAPSLAWAVARGQCRWAVGHACGRIQAPPRQEMDPEALAHLRLTWHRGQVTHRTPALRRTDRS